MARASLRSRILVGSILWTLGLLVAVSMAMVQVMIVHPPFASHLHGILLHVGVGSAIAVTCLAAGLWQVRRGLATVDQLRRRLSSVHHGETSRLTGEYPLEVQPLVDDLNALLEQRENTVRRAMDRAGDLAHGLKTPLAVLSQEAQRAGRSGHLDVAASVGQQVTRMRTQIDYHLAQARAAASGSAPGTQTLVAASADAVVRTLLQLYVERGLAIDVRVDAGHVVACQREDLDEMLGNLLDNACKWARHHVAITSSPTGAGTIIITVDDDGPGLDPAMRTTVLQRGVRADEAVPGTGLGLAIVRDLAELYRGSIALDAASEGGVRARLELPAPRGS